MERPRQVPRQDDDSAHLTGQACGFGANQRKNQRVQSAWERGAHWTGSSGEGRHLASSLPHPGVRRGGGRPPQRSWKPPPPPPRWASPPEDCNNLWLASRLQPCWGAPCSEPLSCWSGRRLPIDPASTPRPLPAKPLLTLTFHPGGPRQPFHPPLPVLSSSTSFFQGQPRGDVRRRSPDSASPNMPPTPKLDLMPQSHFVYFSIHGFTVLSPHQISEGWNLSQS